MDASLDGRIHYSADFWQGEAAKSCPKGMNVPRVPEGCLMAHGSVFTETANSGARKERPRNPWHRSPSFAPILKDPEILFLPVSSSLTAPSVFVVVATFFCTRAEIDSASLKDCAGFDIHILFTFIPSSTII